LEVQRILQSYDLANFKLKDCMTEKKLIAIVMAKLPEGKPPYPLASHSVSEVVGVCLLVCFIHYSIYTLEEIGM